MTWIIHHDLQKIILIKWKEPKNILPTLRPAKNPGMSNSTTPNSGMLNPGKLDPGTPNSRT